MPRSQTRTRCQCGRFIGRREILCSPCVYRTFLAAETGMVCFPADLNQWPIIPGVEVPGTRAHRNLELVIQLGTRQHGFA